MVSPRSPKPSGRRSIRLRPAHVVLASRTANAGRKPKQSWVQVPETTPSQRPVDLDVGLISRAGCGSSPPAATNLSRCSEVVSRAVRDRETGGSTPLTSTTMDADDTGAVRARKRVRFSSSPQRARGWCLGDIHRGFDSPRVHDFDFWRTVHLVVMAPLHDARGRCDSDVLYETSGYSSAAEHMVDNRGVVGAEPTSRTMGL